MHERNVDRYIHACLLMMQSRFFPDPGQLCQERTQQAIAQMRPELLDITSFCCSWCFMRSSPAFAYEEFCQAAQRSSGLRIVTAKRMRVFVGRLPLLGWDTG